VRTSNKNLERAQGWRKEGRDMSISVTINNNTSEMIKSKRADMGIKGTIWVAR
jgi:hypothetical protein